MRKFGVKVEQEAAVAVTATDTDGVNLHLVLAFYRSIRSQDLRTYITWGYGSRPPKPSHVPKEL